MKDYRSTEEKFEYSSDLEYIYNELQNRIKPFWYREGTHTGPDPDGKTPFLDAFCQNTAQPYAIKLAKGIVNSWMYSEPVMLDRDYLVGFTRPRRPLFEHFSFGMEIDRSVLGSPAYIDRKEELTAKIENHLNELIPLRMDYVTDEAKRRFAPSENPEAYENIMADKLWWVGGFQGHTVPNYDILMRDGLSKIHNRIVVRLAEETDTHKKETLEACKIILEGMHDWILLQAECAEKKAENEKNPTLAQRYSNAAENCRFVAVNAPETFYQAAQLTWFYALWDAVDCIGRADQYLWPFFKKALAENRQYAEDICASLMMKFYEHGIHNITVGGISPETGEDASNDLSFLMLQIIRRNHSTHPRMSIRINQKSDPALMKLAVQMWSEGMSDPTVASDTLIIPSFIEEYGVPEKDAMNYSLLGCQELEIPGKSNFGCEDGLMNLAKILELTLNNGRSRFDDSVQIGLETGHITDYETFDDLWDAYEKQMKFFTRHFVELCNMGQEIRAANYAKLVKTPLTEACIERGLSLDEGGAVFNYGCVETAGAAVVSDSLLAIKKLVFEKGMISRETLEAALCANFEGFEKERLMLQNLSPKYGNDNREADEMAQKVLQSFWTEIKKYKSVRGNVFTGACSLLSSGVTYGEWTWATPDGRLKGEPLGNSIGPKPGNDKHGLTAMLSSCQKLPLKFGLGGTTCNVMIPTSIMRTPAEKEKIADLMNAFLKNGGQLAQITTACLQDLIEARENPSSHPDLIVRVGGFSIRFCELSDTEKDEIISRYAKGEA